MKELFGLHCKDWLINEGMSEYWAEILQSIGVVIFILAVARLSHFLTRRLLITIITKIIHRTKTKWDDILLKRRIFSKIAHFVPALILYYSSNFIYNSGWSNFIEGLACVYMIVLGILLMDSSLSAGNDIYNRFTISKSHPIKGYLQIVKIVFYALGVVSIFTLPFGKNPLAVFAGIGAFAALILLIFRDTILGLVASVQLSANKMVNIGDWISMESKGADGVVIDISLNTVKVQNWDKTISTIPTYHLVSEAFINWRGMEDSGGRRIKRYLNIDVKSIHFLSEEEIQKFTKIELIRNYMNEKLDEIQQNADSEEQIPANQRRLTNIGCFRKYLEFYLHKHPKIHNHMTFLVRQLQVSEKGLPLEIYVFSKDQEWANYEALQSDIFDHILSIVSEFNLKIFQNPTGEDFRKLTS